MFLEVAHTQTIQIQGLLITLGFCEASVYASFCPVSAVSPPQILTPTFPNLFLLAQTCIKTLNKTFLFTFNIICFQLSFCLCILSKICLQYACILV